MLAHYPMGIFGGLASVCATLRYYLVLASLSPSNFYKPQHYLALQPHLISRIILNELTRILNVTTNDALEALVAVY
jgi:hypothetical protein